MLWMEEAEFHESRKRHRGVGSDDFLSDDLFEWIVLENRWGFLKSTNDTWILTGIGLRGYPVASSKVLNYLWRFNLLLLTTNLNIYNRQLNFNSQ